MVFKKNLIWISKRLIYFMEKILVNIFFKEKLHSTFRIRSFAYAILSLKDTKFKSMKVENEDDG